MHRAAREGWTSECGPVQRRLLDEKELALLRTLRNQRVMAFRQSG